MRLHAEGGRGKSSLLLLALSVALVTAVLTATPAPAASRTLTLGPVADTTVRADSPTSTGGTATSLVVEGEPQQHAFLRFDVSGVGGDLVESATLRLYASNGSDAGGLFSRVPDATWDEATLSWNTAPPADPTPFASLGAVSKGSWYEVDVSSLVTGDGAFSLRISSASRNKAAYRSKEASASQRPELLVAVAPGNDTADPTAAITSPSNGATVAGTVDVAVTASDDVGVTSVDLQVDGTVVGSDSTSPYVIPWNSTAVANGPHTLTAVARDAAGKAGTSAAVSVTVGNVVDTGPPTAPTGLTATLNGSTRADLSWTASQDDVGVVRYTVRRNGSAIGTSTTTTYQDEALAAGTTYRYTVVAEDAAGKVSAASNEAVVTTPNPPPPPPSSTVRIGAAGDIGAGTRASASLAKLDKSGVNLFLALGDLSYGETPTEQAWCDYIKAGLPTLGPSFPFQLVTGNHEEQGAPDGYILNFAQCLPDRLGSTAGPQSHYGSNYYFDYPATNPLVRVFMISPDHTVANVTYRYGSGDAQYTWLSNAIDSGRAAGIPWTFVGFHKPCISTSSSGCSIGQPLFNLLLSKKVDLMMAGHNHNYQRSKQLALSSGCPSFVLGGFSQACVADSGAGVMTKGAGSVYSIIGNFGRSGSSINSGDPEAGYFATSNGSANGFVSFTLTRDRLDASYVTSSGTYTDAYTISAAGGGSSDTTPPSAPGNLAATPVGGDRVNLSWNASTDNVGVDHYRVSRNGTVVGTTTGTSYPDTGLTPGTAYAYVVHAVDAANNVSAASNTANATTAPGS
ncbi:MAG TPA: Ig-like domain-containing protein, partial [Actinomycetes bacterium]|nr:Ig-like domain-containing protein [Actinomycetes bacterium]